jgi:polysaccharide lyase-like protein
MSRRGSLLGTVGTDADVSLEPAGPTVLVNTSFGGGNFVEARSCQWEGRDDSCQGYNGVDDYSATVVAFEGRPHVARFEVRDGDIPPFGGNERSEIAEWPNAEIFEGDEVWLGVDIYFPSDFPTPVTDWHIVTQLHPSSGTASPTLTLDVFADDSIYLGNDEPTSEPLHTEIGPIVRGAWTRYLVHFKAAVSSDDGWAEVFQNGTLVVPQHARATVLDGDDHYWKMGIYRANAHTATSVVYFDNLKISIFRPGSGGPGGQAPTYRGSITAQSSTGSTAVSIAAPSPQPELTDYQLVALQIAASSADVPITDPAGWVRRGNIIVQSSPSTSSNSRFVLYEIKPDATLTQRRAAFALTLTAGRVWAAIRGCWAVPTGSTGRTVAVASKAEAEGTASTSHSLPTVNTSQPNSLVIAFGGSDQSNLIASSQSWPSTGLMTQRVSYTGTNTTEIQSLTLADQVVTVPTNGVGGTFTTQSLDECGFFSVVLNGT